MKILLRANVVALFFIGIIVSIISQLDSHTAKIVTDNGSEVSVAFSPFEIISYISFFLWPWVVGINLYKLLPEDSQMNLKYLKVAILVPFILMLDMYLIGWFFPPEVQAAFLAREGIALIIVPLCIFFTCFFYILYFIAKELKSVELKREAKWSDYNATFFFLWFIPIGIWWVQPRINRIFEVV